MGFFQFCLEFLFLNLKINNVLQLIPHSILKVYSILNEKILSSGLTHKAPPIICSRRQLEILPLFQN